MTDVLNSKSEGPNSSSSTTSNMDYSDNTSSSAVVNNNNKQENDKKQKLVYTSDFLRKFDKNNAEKEHSLFNHSHIPPPIQQIPNGTIQPPISAIGPPSAGGPSTSLPLHMNPEFYHDPLEKERQNSEYKSIIQRLKTIILGSKDENLINMMKVVLSEYQYGKSFIDEFGVFGKKFDSQIQNFVYLGDLSTQTPSSVPVTPLNLYFNSGSSAATASTGINTTAGGQPSSGSTSQSSGSLPPLKSPRKSESSSNILSNLNTNISQPSSQNTPTPTATTTKPLSPRGNTTSGNTTTTTINNTNTSATPGAIQPPQQSTSLTNSSNKMKKSPSMPVIASKKDNIGFGDLKHKQQSSNINNSNNSSNKESTATSNINKSNITPTKSTTLKDHDSSMGPGILIPSTTTTTRRPLTSSSSSASIISGIPGSGMVPSMSTNSISNILDHQPRKPMTKSVSMSSISSEANNAIKNTSLEEITGQIYHLTKYQTGCRFLQKKLEENPDKDHVTLIFKEVYEHLIELMIDPYGQYLIPQLMKYCDNEQRRMIVDKIAPKVETFACHIYGIHGIQKVLQFLSQDQVESIIDSIRGKVISLSKDIKGNYLIQSFLKQFSPEVNQFIVDAIMTNTVDICTHKVGCTVVNRCIDHANPSQLEKLVDKITESSMLLVQDQYGNYVVQHLLSNNKEYASKLIKSLLGHIAELSIQKFSSNVIEKCLQVANHDTYESIIKEITEADILNLLQDKYANFVIQTALDVADEQQHAKLVKLIVPYIHQIKTPYVIHIQKKILNV